MTHNDNSPASSAAPPTEEECPSDENTRTLRFSTRRKWIGKRRLLIHMATLCLCVFAIGGGALLFQALRLSKQPPSPTVLTGSLPIETVKTARVGDSVMVTVGPIAATDGLPALLTMIGSYGPRVYHSLFASGNAHFLIPGDDTHQSGIATLIATAGAARGEAVLRLEPDAPVEPITPLVGARSITADAQHWNMSVIVPFDRFGNPVAENTLIDLQVLHPGNQLERQHLQVHNLLAWARIFSRTQAGRATVSAASEDRYGPEATFTEIPGWPVPFTLSANPANVPADGRQFVTLRTDVIRDQFGNTMLDGTLVTFVVDTPGSEPRFIPAYTIDGVAKAQLQAPRQPVQLTVRAEVYNAESHPLQITFSDGPAVNTFPVNAYVNAADQTIELVAGPMLGLLQQFISDGTPVQFLLTDTEGRQTPIDAVSDSGYARAVAWPALLRPGMYTVTVTVGTGHGQTTFQVP